PGEGAEKVTAGGAGSTVEMTGAPSLCARDKKAGRRLAPAGLHSMMRAASGSAGGRFSGVPGGDMVRRLLAGLGKKPALGPRGRGIFGRLFGGVEAPENVAPREEATVIAIGSGKGGTGKSFLATSLAVLLHQQGRRVVLVDCDFG